MFPPAFLLTRRGSPDHLSLDADGVGSDPSEQNRVVLKGAGSTPPEGPANREGGRHYCSITVGTHTRRRMSLRQARGASNDRAACGDKKIHTNIYIYNNNNDDNPTNTGYMIICAW